MGINRELKYALMLFCTFHLISCEEYKFNIPDDWDDPSDMIHFDYATKANRKDHGIVETIEQEQENLEITPDTPQQEIALDNEAIKDEARNKSTEEDIGDARNDCKNPFFRRFVSVLHKKLSHVGSPPTVHTFELELQLDSREWLAIKQFADHCSSNIAEVTRALETMLTSVRIPTITKVDQWMVKFEDFISMSFPDVIKFGIVLLCIVAILTLESISRISWTTQLKRLIFLGFAISILMTYIHEIQIAEAEHKANADIEIPKQCLGSGHEDGIVQGMKSFFNDMFSVKNDECAKYHESFTISPYVKVTPTKVLAVTFTRFAVEPMEHIGTAFSKSFKNIFAGLPITLWIPAFVFVVLVILGFLLIIAVCFGYNFSFNLPFWAGLQMGPQQAVQHNPQLDQVLADNRHHIEQLQATIRELREHPQQALTAPPANSSSSPSRMRGFLDYIGFRSSPPPNATQHTVSPPYPAYERPTTDLPYPEFEPPQADQGPFRPSTEPNRPRSQSSFHPDMAGDMQMSGDGMRNRFPGGIQRPGSVEQSGDSDMQDMRRPPSYDCHAGSESVRSKTQAGGSNPIGFEHFLENPKEDIRDDLKVSSKKVAKVTEEVTEHTTVKRPVQEVVMALSGGELSDQTEEDNTTAFENETPGGEGNSDKLEIQNKCHESRIETIPKSEALIGDSSELLRNMATMSDYVSLEKNHFGNSAQIKEFSLGSTNASNENVGGCPTGGGRKENGSSTLAFNEKPSVREAEAEIQKEEDWEEVSVSECHDKRCDCTCEELDPSQLMDIFQREAEQGISLPSQEYTSFTPPTSES